MSLADKLSREQREITIPRYKNKELETVKLPHKTIRLLAEPTVMLVL